MDDKNVQIQLDQLREEINDLRRHNQQLQLENATLDAIGDGILVVGRGGEIIRINQQFLKMWEISSEEWEQCQTYQDVRTLMATRLHPDRNMMTIQEILRPMIDRLGLADIVLKNDKIFERYAGIKRDEQAVIGYVWSFRDVTDRRIAEIELNRSQAYLRRIMRNLPVILFAFDTEGKITFSQGAALSRLGVKQGELVGINIYEQYKDHEIVEDVERALQGDVTTRAYAFNDAFYEVYMAPMYESDELVGVIGISVDVTNQKRAEEIIRIGKQLESARHDAEEARWRAEQANLAKSTFIANMSHELRTPLNSIIGFSQILDRDKTLRDDQREHISLIMRSSEQLLSMINEILDMAKIESGNIQLNAVDFDLAEILESLDSIYHAKVVEKNMQFITDISDDIPRYLFGDRNKIRQILVNLLSNAVKFTQSGSITMRVWCEDDNPYALYFQVADTGIGIAEHDLPTLFDPFSQTASGRNSGSGTGLGLAITREFTELMDGEITVKSAPGVGTTFTVFLPLQPAKSSVGVPGVQAAVIGIKETDTRHKILVVDDRWENRLMLARMLTETGFVVKEANDGYEAVQVWQTWQPDLIWMDMRMPNMDGYEATRRIRQSQNGDDVVIIALTASAFEQDRERVMSAGCDDFLAKPFQQSDLYNLLEQYLDIEFVYEERAKSNPSEYDGQTPELTMLPEVIRLQLKQAFEELNLAKVEQIVEGFAGEHPKLAQRILNRANEFDFDTLIKWIT